MFFSLAVYIIFVNGLRAIIYLFYYCYLSCLSVLCSTGTITIFFFFFLLAHIFCVSMNALLFLFWYWLITGKMNCNRTTATTTTKNLGWKKSEEKTKSDCDWTVKRGNKTCYPARLFWTTKQLINIYFIVHIQNITSSYIQLHR